MSNPPLSNEHIRHIARLARLDLADGELPDLARRLSAVLEYVAQLESLELEGVEEMSHVADETNILADDQPGSMLDRQVLLDMAPHTFDAFVRVPKVIDEGGS
ncbi:MAG: Asp-tRNA(Asn)/Glu-tRNA(Gln) amidotransferase subunit GatC [Planctomycetota bacterium]|nr:MAG: Asp-tRNA(Asn)/Glu-tRNA(Gln) amidotransferase subunit GatC [Planctomycetota bacterium]